MEKLISDTELAYRVQSKGDCEAMKQILASHSGVYEMLIDKVLPDGFPLKQDMIDDRVYNIYKYVNDYKPDKKMKLSTYIGQRTKWECLNLWNRSAKNNMDEFESSIECSYEQELENLDEKLLLEIFSLAEKYTDPRASSILKSRFITDGNNKRKTWEETASLLNIKPYLAMKILKAFLSSAKEDLKKFI